MPTETCPSPTAFLETARAFLALRPVLNQLPLALPQVMIARPEAYPAGMRCVVARDEAGSVTGAAVQTPPWLVQVADMAPAAAVALADRFAELDAALPGVGGPETSALAFAARYAERTGTRVVGEQAMGVFELTEIAPIHLPPGEMVPAAPGDAPLLQRWLEAFHEEAVPNDPAPLPQAGERAATGGRTWLWRLASGEIVAFAASPREVEGWASVGPVYTPPEHRGHGYATGLVTALSRRLLTTHRGCTLFTDLSNPTSNRIYERIGYRRVGTAARLRFER